MTEKLDTFWSPTPIYAVKRYRVEDGDLFVSMHTGHSFYAGEWYDAECARKEKAEAVLGATGHMLCDGPPATRHEFSYSGTEPVIVTDMLCGFYGLKQPEIVNRKSRHDGGIETSTSNTLVMLAGTVIEHEWGYRAERQLIVRLFEKEEHLPELEV